KFNNLNHGHIAHPAIRRFLLRHTLRPLALTLPRLRSARLRSARLRSARSRSALRQAEVSGGRPVASRSPAQLHRECELWIAQRFYDYCLNTVGDPAHFEKQRERVPARAENTVGEVPDSEWYTDRHYFRPMTTEQIVAGAPGEPPSAAGTSTIIAVKNEGVTPGFTIKDATERHYVVKFDPPKHRELATAADVISSKFFHALGYNVPANYIVYFRRDKLTIGEDTRLTDRLGRKRPMTAKDLGKILAAADRDENGTYRAVASFYLTGAPLVPFRYHGTRKDDPNDIVPHEHRRDLRCLRVFCAWLGHDDSRSINTLGLLVEEKGRKIVFEKRLSRQMEPGHPRMCTFADDVEQRRS
ncbi:MAG TPA: hypothetical protein VES20_05805, partial [Bryobacteraceae bacterium]|nr:hypothetical protein [Bryobacteraceae bacterium]